jgi:hypothetical protein
MADHHRMTQSGHERVMMDGIPRVDVVVPPFVVVTGTFALGPLTGTFTVDVTPPPRVATSVQICVTRFSPKDGGPLMPGTITMTDDHVAHTPIKWADDAGTVPAPADAMVVSADPTIATVAFNSDMTDVDTTPVADGATSWTVSSASLNITDTVSVTVGPPFATSVNADAADTTFTPKT